MINRKASRRLVHPGLRLLAASGLLAGCGSASSGQSITLYSGQHEQTTDGLVAAFEKQTGITVNVRNDDEDTLANLIAVQGRTRQPTSSTPRTPRRWSSCRKRACCRRSNASTLARDPGRVQLAPG